MSEPLARLRRFLRELKRRNVYKVAVAYAAVAFVVAQAAWLLQPALLLPDWFYRIVVVAAILGFPVVLVIAWAFELTPDGVRRTAEAEPDGPGEEEPGVEAETRTAYKFLVGLGLVGAAVAGGWYLTGAGERADEARARSVAVLPFQDVSASGEKGGLGLGLTETIISRLALVEDLSVTPRASVMPYRDRELGLTATADSLIVEHVVDGSVQRWGDSLRITAQLVEAESGEAMWARTFDREFSDIFEVQSEVALSVANALDAEVTGEARERIREKPTQSSAAYELYLRARSMSHRPSKRIAAEEILKLAVEMDSVFAPAYAELSNVLRLRIQSDELPRQLEDSVLNLARRAVEIDPEEAEGWKQLGRVHWERSDIDQAMEMYDGR